MQCVPQVQAYLSVKLETKMYITNFENISQGDIVPFIPFIIAAMNKVKQSTYTKP